MVKVKRVRDRLFFSTVQTVTPLVTQTAACACVELLVPRSYSGQTLWDRQITTCGADNAIRIQ